MLAPPPAWHSWRSLSNLTVTTPDASVSACPPRPKHDGGRAHHTRAPMLLRMPPLLGVPPHGGRRVRGSGRALVMREVLASASIRQTCLVLSDTSNDPTGPNFTPLMKFCPPGRSPYCPIAWLLFGFYDAQNLFARPPAGAQQSLHESGL